MDNNGSSGHKRTRQEWKKQVNDLLSQGRSRIQAFPERAAIITGLLGFLIAVFFKLFVFICVFALIVGYIVWYFSPSSE